MSRPSDPKGWLDFPHTVPLLHQIQQQQQQRHTLLGSSRTGSKHKITPPMKANDPLPSIDVDLPT